MYKKFKPVNERDKRIYMAGLSLSQLIGFRTAREFCMNTVLAVGDVDTDEMLFFSNSIDRDVKNVQENHIDRFTDYFDAAVNGYVREDHIAAAAEFFSLKHLRDSYESGLMSESLEYPCVVEDDTVWIRACYELEQGEDGHLQATVALIDITRLRQ